MCWHASRTVINKCSGVFLISHNVGAPSQITCQQLGVSWASACEAETLSQAGRCLGTALFPAGRFQSRIKKSLNTFVSQIKDSYLSVRGESTARLIRTADSKLGPLRTDLYRLIYDICTVYCDLASGLWSLLCPRLADLSLEAFLQIQSQIMCWWTMGSFWITATLGLLWLVLLEDEDMNTTDWPGCSLNPTLITNTRRPNPGLGRDLEETIVDPQEHVQMLQTVLPAGLRNLPEAGSAFPLWCRLWSQTSAGQRSDCHWLLFREFVPTLH